MTSTTRSRNPVTRLRYAAATWLREQQDVRTDHRFQVLYNPPTPAPLPFREEPQHLTAAQLPGWVDAHLPAVVDHLSYAAVDPHLYEECDRCIALEQRECQRRMDAIEPGRAKAEAVRNECERQHQQAIGRAAETMHALLTVEAEAAAAVGAPRLGGPPVAAQLLMRRWLRRLTTGAGILYALVIDVVAFSTALNFLNAEASATQNTVLAGAGAAMVTAASVKAGHAHADIRGAVKGARTRKWAFMLGIGLLGVVSAVIRATKSDLLDPGELLGGLADQAAVDPFQGSGSNWANLLSAAWFTAVLYAGVALTYYESAEARLDHAPGVAKARREHQDAELAVRYTGANLDNANAALAVWNREYDQAWAVRDTKIDEQFATLNQAFVLARIRLADKLADPAVADTANHAPRVDVTTHPAVLRLAPPFRLPNHP